MTQSSSALTLTGLPTLTWTGAPGAYDHDESDGTLTLVSTEGGDWTNDAAGGPQQHLATSLSFEPETPTFSLSARVTVLGERSTFDAAVLTIWYDRDHWAKLCFEYSPQGQRMVVSVVTDTFSDDVNSAVVDDLDVFLRISALGDGAWAFHASADGERWDFVRVFRLRAGEGPLRVGFMSQAPLGAPARSQFSQIVLSDTPPSDLRDGS